MPERRGCRPPMRLARLPAGFSCGENRSGPYRRHASASEMPRLKITCDRHGDPGHRRAHDARVGGGRGAAQRIPVGIAEVRCSFDGERLARSDRYRRNQRRHGPRSGGKLGWFGGRGGCDRVVPASSCPEDEHRARPVVSAPASAGARPPASRGPSRTASWGTGGSADLSRCWRRMQHSAREGCPATLRGRSSWGHVPLQINPVVSGRRALGRDGLRFVLGAGAVSRRRRPMLRSLVRTTYRGR